MIGKLLGKTAGKILSLPAIVITESIDAVEETIKEVDKNIDDLSKKV